VTPKPHVADLWVQRAVQGVAVFARYPEDVRALAERFGLPPALVAGVVAFLANRFALGAPDIFQEASALLSRLHARRPFR